MDSNKNALTNFLLFLLVLAFLAYKGMPLLTKKMAAVTVTSPSSSPSPTYIQPAMETSPVGNPSAAPSPALHNPSMASHGSDAPVITGADDLRKYDAQCSAGNLDGCDFVAHYWKSSRNPDVAGLYFKKICLSGKFRTDECLEAGELLKDSEIATFPQKCDRGEANYCVMLAGRMARVQQKQEENRFLLLGCYKGFLDACFRGGSQLNDANVKTLIDACLSKGNLKACLIASEPLRMTGNAAAAVKVLSVACERKEFWACKQIGEILGDAELSNYESQCAAQRNPIACAVAVGGQSKKGNMPRVKELLNFSCLNGYPLACEVRRTLPN